MEPYRKTAKPDQEEPGVGQPGCARTVLRRNEVSSDPGQ